MIEASVQELRECYGSMYIISNIPIECNRGSAMEGDANDSPRAYSAMCGAAFI
jgi:hypothetical protein